MPTPPLHRYLALAGASPFFACAVCLNAGWQTLPALGSVASLNNAYGLVIASFMAGVHWGQHLSQRARWRARLALASNAIAIALWLAFSLFSPKHFVVALIAAFALLLWIDQRLYRSNIIDRAYFRTRLLATVLVVLALLSTLVAVS